MPPILRSSTKTKEQKDNNLKILSIAYKNAKYATQNSLQFFHSIKMGISKFSKQREIVFSIGLFNA